MAKNGFKIFDTDTHVGPFFDVLEKYLGEADKARLPAWDQYKSANKGGNAIYMKGQRHYRRRLGAADPQDTRGKYMAGFTGAHGARKPNPRGDYDPALRIEGTAPASTVMCSGAIRFAQSSDWRESFASRMQPLLRRATCPVGLLAAALARL